jgi:hypothetical protein
VTQQKIFGKKRNGVPQQQQQQQQTWREKCATGGSDSVNNGDSLIGNDRKRIRRERSPLSFFLCVPVAHFYSFWNTTNKQTQKGTQRERKTWRMTRQCWAESGWLLLLGLLAFLPTPPPPHWTFCDVHCVLHDGRRPFCLYVVCVSSLDQHPLTSIIFLNDFNM